VTQYEYSFTRYLAAKKSVDNRAINRHVQQVLLESLPQTSADQPLRVLEMGAGIGTMIERMLEWDLFSFVDYTAIDTQTENIRHAQRRLLTWATQNGYQAAERTDGLTIGGEGIEVNIKLIDVDLFDFITDQQYFGNFDLLVAHAFLDLVDIPETLPQIFSLGRNES
jgi:SAM-dependent MidA family methyltransferase